MPARKTKATTVERSSNMRSVKVSGVRWEQERAGRWTSGFGSVERGPFVTTYCRVASCWTWFFPIAIRWRSDVGVIGMDTMQYLQPFKTARAAMLCAAKEQRRWQAK